MATRQCPRRLQRCISDQRRCLTTAAIDTLQPLLETILPTQPTSTLSTRPATSFVRPQNPFLSSATCTLHSFPSFEPISTTSYPSTHLLLPLRRDILHRAVVFEGDRSRQGTASTKWRDDIHGSGRKVRPQKGTGSARLGDKKSPMLRGGGVAHGPTPRDFSTDLQKKVYDLAWRTALSYRFKRGELVVLENAADINMRGPGTSRWLKEMLEWHGWARGNGKNLFVTRHRREDLYEVLAERGMNVHARAKTTGEVDVKDLLESGRVVIEQEALHRIFAEHSSDLR